MTQQSCRSCRHLDVPSNKTGWRVTRSEKTYPCVAPIEPLPLLPDSISLSFVNWPPSRSWMAPEDGETCPLWAALGGGPNG